jgi:RNA polymerase sigma-70 factor (ECF subfamily)
MMGKLLSFRSYASAPAPSDEELLAACARGDRAALGALFDRFAVPLFRFFSRYAGARQADIEDLVQLTFVELERSAGRYRGEASVRAWMFGVAANLGRHHVRGEARRRRMLEGVAHCVPAGDSRPDASAERRQLLARVEAALADLSHDQRVAIVMCDLEEVPRNEAARVLGVPEGTLRRRLHDARKAVRSALEGSPT